MSKMADHFYGDTPVPYPASPGFKEPTTSQDAAIQIKNRAATLRAKVLAAIIASGTDGLTADETATLLNETVLAIRPRVTELKGKIERSGARRKNVSGMSAAVWIKKRTA